MPRRSIIALILTLLLLAGCKHKVTDTSGKARLVPTDNAETPYILEGDYTPDTGVTYKVIIGGDTCFVVVDSIVDGRLYGHYWQLVDGSDCVERKAFSHDAHWKEQRQEALVYLYQEPDYRRADDTLYRLPRYNVNVTRDIEYAQASGYWSSMPTSAEESYMAILSSGLKNGIVRTTQSLTMDIYQPAIDDISEHRLPLLMLMHGGAFYVGDKGDSLITNLCHHFASLGYVAVSINYRLGFLPTKNEIARTGYMALQDAHAAMRYLVSHAADYGIDTALIFVGGASAGSITALNLAFMRDKDRPKAVYAKKLRNLGTIASSGNDYKNTFTIKAVANMWGAVNNLNILKNSHTDIVSFHGDADQVVPYDNGYPFDDMSIKIGKRVFDPMYGSVQIDKRARELGYRSLLYPFAGEGHSLHHYADGSWNQHNYEFLRDKTTSFFYNEIAGPTPAIEEDRNDTRHYVIDDDGASEVAWKVEGGFILAIGANDIRVVWDDSAPRHRLYATGLNAKQFGFESKKEIK